MAMLEIAAPGGGPDLPIWAMTVLTVAAIAVGIFFLISLLRGRGR
ncbi:hypothetical protein [Streptomyces longispororuber]